MQIKTTYGETPPHPIRMATESTSPAEGVEILEHLCDTSKNVKWQQPLWRNSMMAPQNIKNRLKVLYDPAIPYVSIY